MRGWRTLAAGALGGVLLLLLATFGLFVGYPMYLRAVDNPRHAHAVFADYVPYDDVLATRRWHRLAAEGWDCSFGVVALSDAAPEDPPALPENRSGQPWYLAFGGEWAPTPAPPPGDTMRDALGFCAQYFSDDVNRRLTAAMAAPGSWHVIGSVGETIHIYSAPQRIAARVRYGD